MRPADVETINEMIDGNFTFYFPNRAGDYIKEMDFMQR